MIPDDADSLPADHRLSEVGEIIQRLYAASANPVTRARIRVEQEIPLERRGPGWDRHWRELEAYADSSAEWQGGTAEDADESQPVNVGETAATDCSPASRSSRSG